MGAIEQASSKTGVNFAYLVQQASAESSFDPAAKAKTSSASGLYQFIERTWLSMVDKYGAKHGIETDGKTRGELLDMRNDPRAASLMAAELASDNEKFLKSHTNIEIGSTELYFAHFMGAGGAASFLNARNENPLQQAALLFPKAAKANKNVFYDQSTGRAKTLDEVYAFFDKKFDVKESSPANIQIAQAPTKPAPTLQQNHNSLAAMNNLMEIYSAKNSAGFTSNSLVRQSPRNPFGLFNIQSPVEIMLMADLKSPLSMYGENTNESAPNQRRTNQLYREHRGYNG